MLRPKLLPYLQFVTVDGSLTIHGRKGELWEVTGASAADLLRLVPFLDGTHSINDAATKSGLSVELTETIVAYLAEQGLVVNLDQDDGPETNEQTDFLARYDVLSAGHEPARRLSASRVMVIGEASWADDIAEALKRIGVGAVARDKAFPQVLPEQTSLCVVCDGGAGPSIFREANRMLSDMRTPWLRVCVVADLLMVGPLFIPGVTACYTCYETRLISNAYPVDSSLRLYRHELFHGRGRAGASFGAAGMLVGGLVALTALKFLSVAMTCELVGNEYTLDISTLDSALHPVLRVPGCPVCMTARRPPTLLIPPRGVRKGEEYGKSFQQAVELG